jgi:hypothetical protein
VSAADKHPFVVWLVERHGEDNNPLGDFASEIAPHLPTTGSHDELRRRIDHMTIEWALDVFDRLWAEYGEGLL